MKLQPIISWWLLSPYLIAVLSFVGWQFWRIRHQKRRDRPALLARWFRRSALLVLPVIIALGPSVQGGVSSPGTANLDVIFVVDTTPSMGALDYESKRQRIEGVKQDLLALSDGLQGAHMQIITFDTEANVILPLTTDVTAFSTAVQSMTPQINSYSQGSTIDKPVGLMTQELKAIDAAYPDHYRLLFYLGDGEQTAETAVTTFSPAAKYLDGGAVLGYGTPTGARMVKYTGLYSTDSRPTFITTIDTATNELVPAISNSNPASLQKIAKELGVTYQSRNAGGPVDDLFESSQATLAIDRSQRVIHYLNLYWLIAIPFAGLIFWEWQTLVVKLFELRDRRKDQRAKSK